MAFTEEWFAQHQAKMARVHAGLGLVVPAVDRAADSIHRGPLPASAGDEGMGEAKGATAPASRFAPHAERRTQKRTSRSPSAPFTARAERDTGPGGDQAGLSAPGRRTGAKRNRPEQTLQIAAVKFLNAALPPDWRVIHVPNGVAATGERARLANSIRKAMGVRSGFPDLGILGPGRYVVAEAKAGRGQLFAEQREWRDWFIAVGVPWFVFRSIEELEAGCIDAGVPLRGRLA